jgi:glutathione peroxidase
VRTTVTCLLAGLLVCATSMARADSKGEKAVGSVLDHKLKGIDGKDVDLSQYKGKVVMIVNVASKCGLTPQYKGLEAVYEKYKDKGFVIIGVPANEFGGQEPGTDAQIQAFCTDKYHVTFPMMSKVVVKGAGITPLYDQLTTKEKNPKLNGPIQWNFTKFIVDRNGEVVSRFEPRTKPDSPEVISAIETELTHKGKQ